MRTLKTAMFATALCLLPVIALAAKGEVVYAKSGCDYFLVESSMGYALLEWYGGYTPSKGEVIVGDFESYGFKDTHNLTADRETRVWVEDYWLPKARAIEKLFDKCN